MRHFEKVLWKSGIRDIAGVDEAGVAPLAGPVVAAAVMFPPDTEIPGVDDSKRLDAPTREKLAHEIRAKASGVAGRLAPLGDLHPGGLADPPPPPPLAARAGRPPALPPRVEAAVARPPLPR